MATNQERLNDILIRTAGQYDGFNDEQVKYAIKEIERTRLELVDLLNDYANANDVINVNRISSLLRDLDDIKAATYKNGMSAFDTLLTQSADMAITNGAGALETVMGVVTFNNAESFNRISAEVVRYVVNRFEGDGLVLSDRVWALSVQQRAELESVIRTGIIRGESVTTLIAKVRKVYENETWKIRRLVVTEGNIAYRTGSAYVAQQSSIVQGLRIHKGVADRPEHRCTQLEKIDRYGLGKGVYLPTDSEVLHPHPNCTSYVTYELVEGV